MIGTELLDDPRADPVAVERELRDIGRLNALFGGTRAVVRALEPVFARARHHADTGCGALDWILLDVGTGLGDIPRAAARAARRHGITLHLIGVELNRAAARLARAADVDPPLAPVLADGGALPLAPHSVDVIVASQVLHHVPRAVAVRWLAAFHRLARHAVVVADLRRSWLAMAGVWAACLGLGMGRVTRRDAVLSLRRGYTRREFDALLAAARVPAAARRGWGARIVATWCPTALPGADAGVSAREG
jgi:SAM-dependent methyltransferase